jgi:hypothetical protein
MASACLEEEIDRNTGSPSGEKLWFLTGLREKQARSCGVADRLVVLKKPGNAGGGKEPDFWLVAAAEGVNPGPKCVITPWEVGGLLRGRG